MEVDGYHPVKMVNFEADKLFEMLEEAGFIANEKGFDTPIVGRNKLLLKCLFELRKVKQIDKMLNQRTCCPRGMGIDQRHGYPGLFQVELNRGNLFLRID